MQPTLLACEFVLPAVPFRRALLRWYSEARRDLPWRRTRDPYCIWISEIMLQQTRVVAAVPYYERFLERFPDAAALARASESEVLTAWAGLGYYSRARNLHRAAKLIARNGGFPRDYAAIRALPGIGDYTAAAIAGIAFDLPHAVLDGNVMRVLTRLSNDDGDIASAVTKKRLAALAASLLDRKRPGDFNQAVMELGATVCLPRDPQCLLCPVAAWCAAREAGSPSRLPVKSGRKEPVRIDLEFLAIRRDGKYLLRLRPPDSARMAGFWELPEPAQLPLAVAGDLLGRFRHTITHHRYSVTVRTAAVREVPPGFEWIPEDRLRQIPLSTLARKALRCAL
jgi:A/G-specific adenine glycosylase